MSDPFEARMRFTGMLQGLNATTTASHKAALYALKFKDYDEDFQSCILEQLGRVSCLAMLFRSFTFGAHNSNRAPGRLEQSNQHHVLS